MKKIITILMLVALPFMALTLNSCSSSKGSNETLVERAKGTYDSTIDVTLITEGESEAQPQSTATIILKPSAKGGDNKVDLSLKGFEFPPIGAIPIEITEVTLVDGGNGKISFNHEANISIELIPGSPSSVPTTIVGTIVGNKLDVTLKVKVNTFLQVDVKVAGTKK